MTDFVDKALALVFQALQVDPSQFGEDIPGHILGFLTSIWNAALDFAKDAIKAAIRELTAPIVAAVRSALAVAVTISVVVSYLKPWTVRIDPAPAGIHLAVEGGAPVRGEFDLFADVRVDQWPPTVADCAATVGVQPPALAAVGAPVTWAVRFGSELITPDIAGPPFKGQLDSDKRAVLAYQAMTEPAAWHQSGPLVFSSVRVSAEIERKEVTDLLRMAEQMFFESLPVPDAVRRVVQALLAPQVQQLLDVARARLPSLLKATGAATLAVERHGEPTPTPPPAPSGSPPAEAVWVRYSVPPNRLLIPREHWIEIVACDGPWGTWEGVFRAGGIVNFTPIAVIPISFTVGGSGEQTVRFTTPTVSVPLATGGAIDVGGPVDVTIHEDGKSMTISAEWEASFGGAITLPIEPAPAGRCP
ncbi:MAG: hypothetical protein H0V04_06335 [Chloroflexi bacterium]|nr:hypothetical protein [Chloroflexota bacterium]